MDGFLKVAGAAQVCQDDKLDETRRKQDAAQAAFSTLQTIGKYLSAGDKTSNNGVHQVLRSVSASRLLFSYRRSNSLILSRSFNWNFLVVSLIRTTI